LPKVEILMKPTKEIFYKCPKCKNTEDFIVLRPTGLKKRPAIVMHTCSKCGSGMVRHVVDTRTNPKLQKLTDHAVQVPSLLSTNKDGTLTSS